MYLQPLKGLNYAGLSPLRKPRKSYLLNTTRAVPTQNTLKTVQEANDKN